MFGQWRTGYYSSGAADGGLAVPDIYFAPYTHLVHYNSFPVVNRGNVSLDVKYYGVLADADALIARAHAAGVRVLLGVGIGGAEDAMAHATDSAHLSSFVDVIMQFVTSHDYDGVDIDWEGSTFGPARYPDQFHNTLLALRARLDTKSGSLPKGILTAFFGPEMVAAQSTGFLDQVNVACYDNFSWALTLTWHNSALYDPLHQGDNRTCDNVVDVFVNAGVPESKIGVGIPFYVYRWFGGEDANGQGAKYPGQHLKRAAQFDSRTYAALVSDPGLWQDQYKRWDTGARVPYLSIDKTSDAPDTFVTYEDERSIAEKWTFVQERQLGGLCVYPIGGDWIPDGPTVAAQHPLSEALRASAASRAPDGRLHRREPRSRALLVPLCLTSLLAVCFVAMGRYWRGRQFRMFLRSHK